MLDEESGDHFGFQKIDSNDVLLTDCLCRQWRLLAFRLHIYEQFETDSVSDSRVMY